MLFVTISPKQAAQYEYMCTRLSCMVNKMSSARKTFENIANTSFNKPFAKCMYLLASESLQCENEIRSQIDSLNCLNPEDIQTENKRTVSLTAINNLESVCSYFEDIYLASYKKLLNDKHFGRSIKNLMENHVQLFMSSLTQLRLFNDVTPSIN